MSIAQLASSAHAHPAVLARIETEIEHCLTARKVAWEKYISATTDADMEHWGFRVQQWNTAIAIEVAKLYPQYSV